ncbi:MAG TPA: helix-turn-helix transcriptional regulator [Solirubrobacteraceae bacterium]|nr:helix-turn-helix transcriptional regulator [Solirubrobacteraceae bacterium]
MTDSVIPGRAAIRRQDVTIHRPVTIENRTSLLRDAVSIIEQDYASELSLDDVARRIASSRRQLQRAYAEIGRTTFRRHLAHVRMKRAAEMLQDGRLTVREVAHSVGYRQPAQFAKAFRRQFGVAPSDYRAAARAGHAGRHADDAQLAA